MSTTLASSSTTTTGGGVPTVDDASLVYHINLLFVALLAGFALVRLPRAFALFGTSSEWFNGHFLRHTPYRPSGRRFFIRHGYSPQHPSDERGFGSSDDSHIPYTHAQRVTEKAAAPPPQSLHARIAPGFSVIQFLVLATYFYSLVYTGFYRSNIFTDPARTGWIATAQLPFVFAFAQKNNVLGSIIGYGYERLNFLHRFAGKLVVLAANIHSIHYFYAWSLDGTFTTEIKTPAAIWGTIALICLDILFFFSTEYWRGKAYNIFLTTHIVGFILVLPALYLHKAPTLPYILASVGIYAYDHLLRLLKSRLTSAYIRPLPELEMTRHVRLRVMSAGMGWVGWAEVHPFTIASKAGRWTRRLYEIAKMGGYTEGGVGREVKVIIEGPYGHGLKHNFSSFSGAVFVAGGSGVTYALSAIQDLVQKDLAGESRVKIIELVWIVPDPGPWPRGWDVSDICSYAKPLPPGLSLAPGRPRLLKFIEQAIQRAVTLGGGRRHSYNRVKDDELSLSGLVVDMLTSRFLTSFDEPTWHRMG
ncbi:hypothetical protein BDZ97DRAFT_1940337 [Flammula alnicola]|nr:hypothetical protein BDZ97DRAFT_1940337 [Flammula alnicola]